MSAAHLSKMNLELPHGTWRPRVLGANSVAVPTVPNSPWMSRTALLRELVSGLKVQLRSW